MTKNIIEGENQFGFRYGMGCQHAYKILSSLPADNSSMGNGLYICALDLSKAFDSVVDSQILLSLYNSGVNLSVIMLLRFWYSNSFLSIKIGNRHYYKGAKRSKSGWCSVPYAFKICISSVLAKISGKYLSGLADVSYIC